MVVFLFVLAYRCSLVYYSRKHRQLMLNVAARLGAPNTESLSKIAVTHAWNSDASEVWYKDRRCSLFVKHSSLSISASEWFSQGFRGVSGEHLAYLLLKRQDCSESALGAVGAEKEKIGAEYYRPPIYYSEVQPWVGWFAVIQPCLRTTHSFDLLDPEIAAVHTLSTYDDDGNNNNNNDKTSHSGPERLPSIASAIPSMLDALAQLHVENMTTFSHEDGETRQEEEWLRRRWVGISMVRWLPRSWFTRVPLAVLAFVYVIHWLQHRGRYRYRYHRHHLSESSRVHSVCNRRCANKLEWIYNGIDTCREVWIATKDALQHVFIHRSRRQQSQTKGGTVGSNWKTLIHADAHCGNFLLRGDRALLIDWASLRVGSPFFDFAYLLVSSVPGDIRKKHYLEWADCYAKALTKHSNGAWQCSASDVVANYNEQLAAILLFHVLPFAYNEGTIGRGIDQAERLNRAFLTRKRIMIEAIQNTCDELDRSRPQVFLTLVSWVVHFGCVYTHSFRDHPEYLIIRRLFDQWQQQRQQEVPLQNKVDATDA